MKRTRKKYTSKFKTQVVLKAIKERQTLFELAEQFDIHPNQIESLFDRYDTPQIINSDSRQSIHLPELD